MYCTYCGAKTEGEALYCPNCGRQMASFQLVAQPEPRRTDEPACFRPEPSRECSDAPADSGKPDSATVHNPPATTVVFVMPVPIW